MKVKGDSVRFYKGASILDLEMEVSLSCTLDTIETTIKGNNFKTFIGGDKSWSASGKANIDWDSSYNISGVFADYKAGDSVGISIGYLNNFYSGGGIFTKFAIDAVHNDLARISFDLQGLSSLTETASINAGFPYVFPYILS